MSDVQKQLDLLCKEIEVNAKTDGMEFQRIAGAFQKLGNLVDLLYLEVAVLLDVLSKKKILSEEEFAKQLEDTSKHIAEHVKKSQEAKEKTAGSSLVSALDEEKKDEPKIRKTD